MIRYYCSGFDYNNPFGHGLGDMIKKELKDTKSIVFIVGSPKKEEKIKKAQEEKVPSFIDHFKKVGIVFESVHLITPYTDMLSAKKWIDNANFVMLMGGNPIDQKQMCVNLDIMENLKKFNGVMMGYSAGAMLMSKYIIITPCSEEYPNFQIEEGLNFDNISIYPHCNTQLDDIPDEIIVGNEVYKKEDLIKVSVKYGSFYLLQDYEKEDGTYEISLIKSNDGKIEYYRENNGRIWKVDNKIMLY